MLNQTPPPTIHADGRKRSNRAPRYRFDYDAGYLVKSPCRECELRDCIPACIDSCHWLDGIQELLVDVISCRKSG
jgi:hypothetical protein